MMLDDTETPTLQETHVNPAPAEPLQPALEAAPSEPSAPDPRQPSGMQTPAMPQQEPELTATRVQPPAEQLQPRGFTPDFPQQPAEEEDETDAPPAAGQGEGPFRVPETRPTLSPEALANKKALEAPVSMPTAQLLAPAEKDEQTRYWEGLLTGDPGTVPDTVRAQAGCDDLSLDADEQDYRLVQSINRSWLADHSDLSREQVRDSWPAHRRKLAKELGVADDEMEVFCGLSIMQKDTARREAARTIHRKSYMAGLLGEDYKDDTETLDTLDAEDRAMADALGVGAYQEGADLRAKWLPLVKRAARGMDVYAGMEEEMVVSPRVLAGTPDLIATIDRLCDLKPEEQELVLALAADMVRKQRQEKADGGEESTLGRMYRSFNRGAANLLMNAGQAVENTGIVTYRKLGRTIGGDFGRALTREAANWDRRTQMSYRLRNMSQLDISPLYPQERAKEVESYFIDAAEATPSAILSFCGPYGFAALACSGVGRSIAEARARAPQGDHELQLMSGMTAGVVQAGIYMGLNRVGGKMLERAISGFSKSQGAGAAAFTMNSLKTAGAVSLQGAQLWAAGKLSTAVDLGAQEIAAQLSDTASNIDWKSFGDNMTDIDANMHEAAGLLPFLLIGSGRVALRHFRSPQALLGDGEVLKEWGIDEPTQKKIMAASNIETQGTLLRVAIRRSPRWSSRKLRRDAVRAMQLLNVDYFKSFQQEDAVVDFLRLPAETSQVKKPEPVDRPVEEVKGLPQHALDRSPDDVYFKDNERFNDCMKLWDSWWQRSHIDKYAGPYFQALMDRSSKENARSNRSAAYQIILNDNESPVPPHMRNSGYMSLSGEAERRALLRDTVMEISDLSYQFIMCAYPLDSLIKNIFPPSRSAKRAEISRKEVIGQVGRAIMNMAMGVPRDTALRDMRKYLSKYLIRRSYRGASPTWLEETPHATLNHMPDLISFYDHYAFGGQDEFRQALRVLGGLSASAYRLVNLLPMSKDFSTALSRGMSPLQAFHHLTQRELGYDPEKVNKYPLEAINASGGISNWELFGEESANCFARAKALTGRTAEQTDGEDGTPYWRALAPEGGFTRWHDSEQNAINDLALSAAPYFAPIGDGYFRWLRFFGNERKFDPTERPKASYKEFCGFDQLAGTALQELKDHYFAKPTLALPGFYFQRLRKRLGGHRSESPVRVQTYAETPRTPEPDEDIIVDSLSTLTPYSLMNSRFLVFWKRMLDSRFVPAEEVEDLLQERGFLTDEERAKLQKRIIPLPYPRNPDTPLNQTPPPDIGGRNRYLAERMAQFQSIHFFSELDKRDVPESVRRWFNLVPYCPALPPEECGLPVARYVSMRIPFGKDGRTALAWSNRRTAMDINDQAGEFERLRNSLREHPLPEGRLADVFRMAYGNSPAQRYEQAWCYYRGGAGVLFSTPQYMWNLLHSPRHGWEVMSPEERKDLSSRVGDFTFRSPVTSALDAAGRGEEVDYLEHALHNLDDVLQRHPDLHRYAPVDGKDGRVLTIDFDDSLPPDPALEGPDFNPTVLQLDNVVDGEYIQHREETTPPEFLQEPDTMLALQLLDALRYSTTKRPYVMNHTIWWNDRPYGGLMGDRPRGLLTWEVDTPVDNLFQLFRNIDSLQKGSNGKGLNICGVKVRGADWELEDFSDLLPVSVYRWPENRSRVYRMMPGFPQSSSMDVRTPYFTLCHRGLYVGDGKVISKPEDLYLSYQPMELFSCQKFLPVTDEHLRDWRKSTIEHTFKALADWPEKRYDMVDDWYSGVHGLNELLLRLCEDTGFSISLAPHKPNTLSKEQAYVVNIARATMECMLAPDSPEALAGLSKAMKPVMKKPELRQAVIDMLYRCSDAVESASPNRRQNGLDFEADIEERMFEQKCLQGIEEAGNHPKGIRIQSADNQGAVEGARRPVWSEEEGDVPQPGTDKPKYPNHDIRPHLPFLQHQMEFFGLLESSTPEEPAPQNEAAATPGAAVPTAPAAPEPTPAAPEE